MLHPDVLVLVGNNLSPCDFVTYKQVCKVHQDFSWSTYFLSHFDDETQKLFNCCKIDIQFMKETGKYLLNIKDEKKIKQWFKFIQNLDDIVEDCYPSHYEPDRYSVRQFISIEFMSPNPESVHQSDNEEDTNSIHFSDSDDDDQIFISKIIIDADTNSTTTIDISKGFKRYKNTPEVLLRELKKQLLLVDNLSEISIKGGNDDFTTSAISSYT
jgi:hypothetical protein